MQMPCSQVDLADNGEDTGYYYEIQWINADGVRESGCRLTCIVLNEWRILFIFNCLTSYYAVE